MPDYDPTRLALVLDELRQGRNESYRETSLNAGLDHGTLRRYVCDGRRPQRQALIALADHFGVNPNELLPLAGYPPMKLFERVAVDPDSLPSDIGGLVEDLQCIPDRAQRRKLVEAVRVLLAGYLPKFED
jgi:transcriptional regulator with XRE-family HTH domain